MRRQVRSVVAEVVGPDGSGPPRPWPIPSAALTEGVALVEDACRGRRPGRAGLESAVGLVCRSAGFEVGHVYLGDTTADRILPSHIWHLQPPAGRFAGFVRATMASPLVPGQGLPGRVLCTGAPVVIDPLPGSAHMARARAAIASGLHAACGFPLRANPSLTVVLEFLAGGPVHPDGDLDVLLERLTAVLLPHLRDLGAEDLQ